MASIESRIGALERCGRPLVQRQLTDTERAIRLIYILKNPALSALHAPLRKLLHRNTRCWPDECATPPEEEARVSPEHPKT